MLRNCGKFLRGRLFSTYIFRQEQKGQLLLFPNMPIMRQGSLISVNNNECLAIVLAVLNQHSIALLFKKGVEARDIKMVAQSRLFVERSSTIGMSNVGLSEGGYPIAAFKSSRPRASSGRQIATGNVLMDLFHPLAYGQFLYLHSRSYVRRVAACFDQTIVLNGQKLSDTDIVVKSQGDLAGDYFLPNVAANVASDHAASKKTLLVVENLAEHIRANQIVQREIIQSMTQAQAPDNTIFTSTFLGDIAERCGFRQNTSDLTVAVIHDPDVDPHDPLRSHLTSQLEQHASMIVPKTPKLMPPTPRNLSYQSRMVYFIAQKMYTLLQEYEQQKNSYTLKQKLDIQIEPWDYYHYLDGKVWMDLLKEFNKQQDSDHIDLVILCWWIIRAVETETIAHIKGIIAKFHHHYQDSPKTLLEDIKSFANSFKADKDDLPLKQYYQQKLKELGDSQYFQTFIVEHLNRFFELHVIHLRMGDRLLPFKKDHFTN